MSGALQYLDGGMEEGVHDGQTVEGLPVLKTLADPMAAPRRLGRRDLTDRYRCWAPSYSSSFSMRSRSSRKTLVLWRAAQTRAQRATSSGIVTVTFFMTPFWCYTKFGSLIAGWAPASYGFCVLFRAPEPSTASPLERRLQEPVHHALEELRLRAGLVSRFSRALGESCLVRGQPSGAPDRGERLSPSTWLLPRKV